MSAGILPIEDVCADIESEVFAIVDRQDVITDLLQVCTAHMRLPLCFRYAFCSHQLLELYDCSDDFM